MADLFMLIDILSAGLWLYLAYQGTMTVQEALGGRFTNAALPLYGAFTLFTIERVLYNVHQYVVLDGAMPTPGYRLGLRGITLIGSILLLIGVQRLLDLDFLTSGFGTAVLQGGENGD